MIDKFEGEYAFLSNFYSSPIVFNAEGDTKIIAETVEHYFQASKTLDLKEALNILAAPTPGVSKRLGRKCRLRSDWEKIKDAVMRDALIKKFEDAKLREKLIATGDEYLKEGNWWHDNYWGSCSCDRCNDHGQNRLGLLLMEIREKIKEGKLYE